MGMGDVNELCFPLPQYLQCLYECKAGQENVKNNNVDMSEMY